MAKQKTLTMTEQLTVRQVVPYLQEEEWDDALFQIAVNRFLSNPNSPLHVLLFLEEHGFDLLHKVSKLPPYTFCECTDIQSITIPSNIRVIEDDAFRKCKNLKKVIISQGVEEIGSHAFAECDALNDITIPNSVKYIQSEVFSGCDSLQEIKYDGTEEEWDAIYKYRNSDVDWNGSNANVVWLKE